MADNKEKVGWVGRVPPNVLDAAVERYNIKNEMAVLEDRKDQCNNILLGFLQGHSADYVVCADVVKVNRIRKTNKSIDRKLLVQNMMEAGVDPDQIVEIVDKSTRSTISEYVTVSAYANGD